MQLSYAEFESQSRHLASVLPDTLSWHAPRFAFHVDSGYLAAHRRPLSLHSSGSIVSAVLDEEEVDGGGRLIGGEADWDTKDAFSRGVALSERAVVGEYAMVYSSSYCVPVLLFRFDCVDGQPLCEEETLAVLQRISDGRSPSLCSQLTSTAADFPPISATLHPALGTPFFSLHPCQTRHVMAVLQSAADSNPSTLLPLNVLAWLSAIGPFVGLLLPFSHSLQSLLAVDVLPRTTTHARAHKHAAASEG